MAATTLLIKSPIVIPFNSIHPIPKSYHHPLISSYTKIPSNNIQFPRSFSRCRRRDMSRVGAVSDGGGGDGGGDGNSGGGDGGGGGGGDNDSSSIFSWYLALIKRRLTSGRQVVVKHCQIFNGVFPLAGPIFDGKAFDDDVVFLWSLRRNRYLMALDKYPVATKAITSAFLTLVGDLICQLLIDKVTKLDLKRTFVFTFLGLVLVGPTLHIWYLSLSKMVKVPGASGTFLRLLLDQFVFSPLFIGVFLSSLVTLEGRPSQLVPKLQQEWFSSVLANWQLWIPFQFLNFQFVPQKFQVLAANFVALAWNVILSFKAHKEIVVK